MKVVIKITVDNSWIIINNSSRFSSHTEENASEELEYLENNVSSVLRA